MNKSTISREDRPTTPFGQDNPFNLSKMGYANPAAIERTLPSAMKSRPKAGKTPTNNSQFGQNRNEVSARQFNADEYEEELKGFDGGASNQQDSNARR